MIHYLLWVCSFLHIQTSSPRSFGSRKEGETILFSLVKNISPFIECLFLIFETWGHTHVIDDLGPYDSSAKIFKTSHQLKDHDENLNRRTILLLTFSFLYPSWLSILLHVKHVHHIQEIQPPISCPFSLIRFIWSMFFFLVPNGVRAAEPKHAYCWVQLSCSKRATFLPFCHCFLWFLLDIGKGFT